MTELEDLRRRIAELEQKLDGPKKPAMVRGPTQSTTEMLATQGLRIPRSAREEMTRAVDDRLVRDIVSDQRAGPTLPASQVRSEPKVVEKGTGWAPERKLDHPLDAWAGRMLDEDLARRK